MDNLYCLGFFEELLHQCLYILCCTKLLSFIAIRFYVDIICGQNLNSFFSKIHFYTCIKSYHIFFSKFKLSNRHIEHHLGKYLFNNNNFMQFSSGRKTANNGVYWLFVLFKQKYLNLYITTGREPQLDFINPWINF